MVDVTADVDTIFEWKEEEDSEYNICRLRIYWITWEKAVVITKNLSEDSSNSITDITKKVIYFTNHYYDLVSNKLMLIEHYSTNDKAEKDIYVQVIITNDKAVRCEIQKSQLVELIGKSI